MIGTGLFFREDVEGATGGKWQALCPTPTGVELLTTQVEIRAVPHPLEHEKEKPTGGRSVEADRCKDAVVLLRLPGLTDGPVPTSAMGPLSIPEHHSTILRLGSSTYMQLGAEHERTEDPLLVIAAIGDGQQQLAKLDGCCNDTWPGIVWAGDLDRDGKIDLLLNLSIHYAAGNLVLFLSSAAKPGELLGEVARFESASC
ncbi:MAG: hypothetical protein FJ144_14900 [Deltaproteobacteria bacterium]|nr:hypothetical protein [Deltaproteobacteria bacterium]